MATVFTLSITCENEAFGPDDVCRAHEVARILRHVSRRLEAGHVTGQTRDENGNPVGSYAFAETDDAADKIRDAAPEMLAALKAIVARRQGAWDYPGLVSLGPLGTAADDMERLALAAIAKVEG